MNGAINYTISRKMKNILNKLFLETTQSTLLQLFRYGFVGGVAFVADYGTLYLFTEAFHIYHLLSAAIAFVIGLLVNYLLSTSWVFASRTQKNKWIEFAIFAIITILSNSSKLLFVFGFIKVIFNFNHIKLFILN